MTRIPSSGSMHPPAPAGLTGRTQRTEPGALCESERRRLGIRPVASSPNRARVCHQRPCVRGGPTVATPTIPQSAEAMTPEWLTAALREHGVIGEATVTGVDATVIGARVGILCLLHRL